MKGKQLLDYSSLQWVSYLFLGGAIYAIITKSLVLWYFDAIRNLSSNEFWILMSMFVVLVFFSPILLSFLLTRFHPEKRLVPPLLIQIIAFAFLLVFYNNDIIANLLTIYTLGMYSFLSAIFQDSIAVYFLGINAKASDFTKYSFSIACSESKAKEIFDDRKFKDLFDFPRKFKHKNSNLVLRTYRNSEIQSFLEVKGTENPKQTTINLVYFTKRRYDVKALQEDPEIVDIALTDLASIKDFLNRKYSLSLIDLPSINADRLANIVLDDYQGAITHMHSMSLRQQLSIIFAIVFIGASTALFIFDKIDWGLATLAIGVVLVIDSVNALRE